MSTISLLNDLAFVFGCVISFFAYGFIGTLIGIYRHEDFYSRCESLDDRAMFHCYIVTAFLWPLAFPFRKAKQ